MTDLSPLIDESSLLKEGTKIALGFTASELVQEQIQIRKDFKLKIAEAKRKLSDQIDELEHWKRLLGTLNMSVNNDLDQLTAYFWECLREEREATRH